MFEWGGMRLVTVVTPIGTENRCADHPNRPLPPFDPGDCRNCTAMMDWRDEFQRRYQTWKSTGIAPK